jgi:hypothetical protein
MRSAEWKMFHNGNGFEIEVRFRRRIFIWYGKIKKIACQRKDCSGTQYIDIGK